MKEVYHIDKWLPAENEVRETIPYNEVVDAGRIIFKGRTADEEIRKKYLDHSVTGLFKRGEVAPVKVILKLWVWKYHENSTWNVERVGHKGELDRIQGCCKETESDILFLAGTDAQIKMCRP